MCMLITSRQVPFGGALYLIRTSVVNKIHSTVFVIDSMKPLNKQTDMHNYSPYVVF